MIGAVRYAVLVSIAAAVPALAQTAATPGSVTSNGIVTLGTGTSGSAVSPTTSITPAAAATDGWVVSRFRRRRTIHQWELGWDLRWGLGQPIGRAQQYRVDIDV
jgi:hypothetical protein